MAAILLAGCQALVPPPKVDVAEPTHVRPQPVVQPVVANGSIFQAQSYRPLFEDHRARLVGDTITVTIVEKVSASQKSSANTFSGKGATESSNDFSGTITAVVTEVLPNGHLVIAGEKQIGVSANVDVLRFSGQVDPRAILAGNTVPSVQIANVRVEQRGRGQQAEAQGMGWLARFFLSVLPIY